MRFVFLTALLAALSLLCACGGTGGGSGGDAGSDAPAASGITLAGVVAVGEPVVGATVFSWCGDGKAGPRTKTDATGNFALDMPADCLAPWLVRALGGTPSEWVLLSFTDHEPSGTIEHVPLNITPITTTVVELMSPGLQLRETPEPKEIQEVYMSLIPAAQTNKTKIEDQLNMWLSPTDPDLPGTRVTYEEVMSKKFIPVPGDPMDDLLVAFSKMRGNVSQDALVEQLVPSGGSLADGQPWKTLFGEATSLSLSAVDCTASGNPVGTATLTLRMNAKDLQVELASDLFGAPRTFTVGPAANSDFRMTLNGDSPLVRVSAASSGSRIELFADAGVAKVSLSALGRVAVCTLSNPVKRADLVAFQPAARILSVVPAAGASGSCAATDAGAAYDYEISKMGNVRFNGASLPANWLDAPYAYYSESLQYGMGGPGAAYQVQLAALPTGQGIQPYYFSSVPYAVNCTSSNP